MRRADRLAHTAILLVMTLLALLTAGCRPTARRGDDASSVPTAVEQVAVQSSLLGRSMPVLLFRPRNTTTAGLPILYVFHGYGADETAWFDGLAGDGIHLDAQAQALIDAGRICPVVIASAFIGNSYGVDSAPAGDRFDHGPYAQYLIDELLPTVERAVWGTNPSNPSPGRYLAGLSMGGFAALHLALGQPGRVAGVGALSPAMFVETPDDRRWLFDGDPDRNDPMRLVRTAELGGLRWFLGDGSGDYGWIRTATAEFARRLAARGVDVPIRTVPGGHDAGTWRQLVAPLLEALLAPPCPAPG